MYSHKGAESDLTIKTMKKQISTLIFAVVALAAPVIANDQDSMWQKAYPAAEKGMNRFVLHLPKLADESAAKVELIVGKEQETDGVNIVHLGGNIVESDVEGWGYPRYDVTIGPGMSTLIGVPPGQATVKKFVTLAGNPYLIRYNSKLPVVVYVPEGYELRYRIWTAGEETKSAGKG
jgi:ecotin